MPPDIRWKMGNELLTHYFGLGATHGAVEQVFLVVAVFIQYCSNEDAVTGYISTRISVAPLA